MSADLDNLIERLRGTRERVHKQVTGGYGDTDTIDEAINALKAVDDIEEEERAIALSAAGGDVVEKLLELYRLNDGDEAAIGEMMYEIDKVARRRWSEESKGDD